MEGAACLLFWLLWAWGVSCSPCKGRSGLNLGDGTLGFLGPR